MKEHTESGGESANHGIEDHRQLPCLADAVAPPPLVQTEKPETRDPRRKEHYPPAADQETTSIGAQGLALTEIGARVTKQYRETAGRIETRWISVFAAFADSRGWTFLHRELYMPRK